MNIVILGATGQIGKLLFVWLKNNSSLIVTGTSRSEDPAKILLKFDPFKDNWEMLGKVDVLINCIGQIRETMSVDFYKVHVRLTEQIVRNRLKLGNPRIIQISALGASAIHRVKFLKTKGVADNLLLQEKETVIVRPGIVCTSGTMMVRKFQRMMAIARKLKQHVLVPAGFLDHKIQPVLPADLAEVIEKLCLTDFSKLEESMRIINVVGPDEISYRQLLTMASETQHVKVVELGNLWVRIAVRFFVSPVFPDLITYDQYRLLFEDNIASSELTERIIGHPPSSTINFLRQSFST